MVGGQYAGTGEIGRLYVGYILEIHAFLPLFVVLTVRRAAGFEIRAFSSPRPAPSSSHETVAPFPPSLSLHHRAPLQKIGNEPGVRRATASAARRAQAPGAGGGGKGWGGACVDVRVVVGGEVGEWEEK